MMDGMMGGGWIMMLLGFVLFVLVVAALVAGVVYLARDRWNSSDSSAAGQAPGDDSARRRLDSRYARGEATPTSTKNGGATSAGDAVGNRG